MSEEISQEELEKLIAEKDKAVADLKEAKELQSLRDLGVKEADLDYQRFKISGLSKASGKTFEEVAKEQIKPPTGRYRVVRGAAKQPALDPIREGLRRSREKSAELMKRLSK